jgi:heterodisulfide reductase subunit A
VWEDRCVSAQGKQCGVCAKACPYNAITVERGKAAQITTAKCHGCGGCVAECPHNAITQKHFTDAQILAQIRALLAEKPEERSSRSAASGALMAVPIWRVRATSIIPPMSAASA